MICYSCCFASLNYQNTENFKNHEKQMFLSSNPFQCVILSLSHSLFRKKLKSFFFALNFRNKVDAFSKFFKFL